MLLSFLAVLGGALLTSMTIDVRIGDNYKTHTQALYLAEAGIELARENIRASGLPTLDAPWPLRQASAECCRHRATFRCFSVKMTCRWSR